MALVVKLTLVLLVFKTVAAAAPLTCKHAGFAYDSSVATPFICDSTAPALESPLIADFNGDGRDDFFCNSDGQNDDVFYLSSIGGIPYYQKDPKTAGWCPSNEGTIMTGDINGDGMGDLICRFSDGNKFQVSYYSGGKFSSPRSIRISLTCPLSSTLYIDDVSGDGAEDFVCFDSSSGTIRIHYNGGDHHRYRRHSYDPRLMSHYEHPGYYQMEGSFCAASGHEFRLADLNGDRKKDLLCYDPTTSAAAPGGTVQIAYAQSHGHYRDIKTVPVPHAHSLSGANPTLFVYDINGDMSADMAFIDITGEEFVLYYNRRDEMYYPVVTDTTPAAVTHGCIQEHVYPGDFNGDGMVDIACFIRADSLTIIFSTCTVP